MGLNVVIVIIEGTLCGLYQECIYSFKKHLVREIIASVEKKDLVNWGGCS